MRKYATTILLIFIVSLFLCHSSFAELIKIKNLINDSKIYDGEKITIEAQAIGHVLNRGDYAWLNVNDGNISIGIWAKRQHLDKVEYLGRYAVKGDRLSVSGVFNRSCSLHGGDTDIHAVEVVVVKKGSLRQLDYDPKKVRVLMWLTGILLCLYIIKLLRKPR